MSLKELSTRLFLVLIALALILAACGGDDEDKPAQTALPATHTPAPVVSPQPITPGPTATAYLLPPAVLFEEAARQAQVGLAERLNLSITQVIVLEPDTALLLSDPLDCPEVTAEDATVYYVYVQYQRFIYPYQFYTTAGSSEPVVEGCSDILVDEEVLYVPTPNERLAVLEQVKTDLFVHGIDPERGNFEGVVATTWTDDALGCRPAAGTEPTPATIDGYLVVYVLDGKRYEYHTDSTGERVVLCTAPPAADSLDILLAQLQTVEYLEAEVSTEEAAAYVGLDRQGTLLLLTQDGYRVGLFEFESPEAARAAAGQIDDGSVSHIFVTGRILIVQEENSPQVYSTLLAYAEEVRTPIIEREEEVPEEASEETPEGE